MKPPVTIFLAAGFSLVSGPLWSIEPLRALQPLAPKTVVIQESQAPPVIRTGLLQSTLIVLPQEEKVANVFAGDTTDWVFDGGRVASRFISVKPKVANATTDVHIVSDHGNEYTLQLHEVSGDDDPHFDSKILLEPRDKIAKDRLVQLPVFVPIAELEQAKQEIVRAKADRASDLKAQESRAEQFRSEYPSQLHFDFSWDAQKAKEFGLQQIWRDDRFTYLRGSFQETPALYEIKDGKGSLINFDFANGLYTVPKQLDGGYLTIGKHRLDFHRTTGRS